MVKMKNLLVVAALFAVTVVGFASCDNKNDPVDALIGEWIETDEGVKI